MGQSSHQEEPQRRILRVNLPVAYHIQLHELRLVTGKNFTETVQQALDLYFADLGHRRRGGGS